MSPEPLAETTPTKRILSEFKADLYANIPQVELVLLAIQLLHNDELPATTEEIVSICFRLFPQSFSLKNYFYWPDSALVARRLQDARERGYIKGMSAEGYALKVKGKQAAKRTAKSLGIELPKPKKVEAPHPQVEVEPVKVETAPPKAAEPESSKLLPKKPVEKKKKSAKQVVTTPKKTAKKTVRKLAAKKESAPVTEKKTVEVKETAKPEAKPKVVKKVVVPVKKAPVQEKESTKSKKPASNKVPSHKVVSVKKKVIKALIEKPKEAKPHNTQPAQLTLGFVAPPAKKKPVVPAGKPKVEKEAKPVKTQTVSPVVQISKEEKDKAGKIVKLMERSDAYQQYKKNGGKARISEFDFRNMLYATMESSAETLKRNVELFKRYAGIHNRTDLITFLTFCEDSFAPLLNAKQPTKKLKI